MRVRVEGSRKFREAATALRQAGRADLRREMTSAMKRAGANILDDQRAEVRGLRVTGQRFYRYGVKRVTGEDGSQRQVAVRYRPNTRSRGLRDRVARSLVLEVKTAGKPRIQFVARPDRMPEGQESLPRHLDNPRGWRHPVFGDTEMWVSQRGGSWFWPPIKKGLRDLRAALDEAITAVVEKIERG